MNAPQCYVIPTLPVLLTSGLCLWYRQMYPQTRYRSYLIEFPTINLLTSFNQSVTSEHADLLMSSCSNLTYRHQPRRLVPATSRLQLLWAELHSQFLFKGTWYKDVGESEGIAPYILNLYSIELKAQFHAAATLTPRNTYPMPLGWEISWVAEAGWDLTWRDRHYCVWNRTPSFGNSACSLITILTEIFRGGDYIYRLIWH